MGWGVGVLYCTIHFPRLQARLIRATCAEGAASAATGLCGFTVQDLGTPGCACANLKAPSLALCSGLCAGFAAFLLLSDTETERERERRSCFACGPEANAHCFLYGNRY